MASDLVDRVIESGKLDSGTVIKPCSTLSIPLNGKDGYSQNLPIRIAQEHNVSKSVANRLATAYGGHAFEVCRIAEEDKTRCLSETLIPGHPYIRGDLAIMLYLIF